MGLVARLTGGHEQSGKDVDVFASVSRFRTRRHIVRRVQASEVFIASEIVKAQANAGGRRELYYFRDQQGLEVDFLMPGRGGAMVLVECKASRTVMPAMAASLQQLGAAMKTKRGKAAVEMLLIHQSPKAGTSTQAVAPRVRALAWQRFVAEL